MLKAGAMQAGFNLIEVLITMVILGVLISLAGPSFFEFLQNSQIRAAADALQNGLQTARGAAIARNLEVQITVGPGSGWTVAERVSGNVIETRVHEEGTPNVGITPTPAGATVITFTPLGAALTPNPDGSARVDRMDFINPSGGACQTDSPAGPMRCLRVIVSGGGSIRMCDPQLTAMGLTSDARACP